MTQQICTSSLNRIDQYVLYFGLKFRCNRRDRGEWFGLFDGLSSSYEIGNFSKINSPGSYYHYHYHALFSFSAADQPNKLRFSFHSGAYRNSDLLFETPPPRWRWWSSWLWWNGKQLADTRFNQRNQIWTRTTRIHRASPLLPHHLHWITPWQK